LIPISLHKTSFANRRPDPAFQVSENPIFTPDLCKGSLAAISFIRLAAKPALTSTPMLFVKARGVAEKLLLLALKVVWTWLSVIGVLSLPIGLPDFVPCSWAYLTVGDISKQNAKLSMLGFARRFKIIIRYKIFVLEAKCIGYLII